MCTSDEGMYVPGPLELRRLGWVLKRFMHGEGIHVTCTCRASSSCVSGGTVFVSKECPASWLRVFLTRGLYWCCFWVVVQVEISCCCGLFNHVFNVFVLALYFVPSFFAMQVADEMVDAGLNLHGTRSVQKVIEVCRNTPCQV